MKEHTKENPGCYHSMLEYLAKIEETSYTKVVEIKSLPKTLKNTIYRSYNFKFIKDGKEYKWPHKQQIKGGEFRLICPDGTQFPVDVKWDKILCTVNKRIDDFKTTVVGCGKYKDCLGGGWSQQVQLWRVNDQYFADMDCAC